MAADSPEAAQMALVSDLIAHICRAGFEDWYIINQLCDLIMTHELCALQSNLSLAEQLRVSANADPVLMRVARLWLILLRNCGHTYIEYNASPATKFIESLENVLTQHPESHSSKRLARVLGSAVYDHAKMDVRHPYTVLWLKIKYPGQPVTVRATRRLFGFPMV
ncbi:hypothetical protein DL93DRAFT_2078715 [Clavulina sp. PMI_390]|nr:hypothetical protein DL93DRAFT_2078715 [Clavulina sp. PMI_390]